MWEFEVHEEIYAPVEAVFDLMSRIEDYPEWNPFIVRVQGEARLGEVVSGLSKLGPFQLPFRHRIYEYLPGRCIAWKDFGVTTAFVCGDRSRTLRSVNGATAYHCKLRISGLLSFLVRWFFGGGLRSGIIAEMKALRELAEGRSAEQSG